MQDDPQVLSVSALKDLLLRNHCRLDQVHLSPVDLLVKFNQEGMKFLNLGESKKALEYLKLAEKIVHQEIAPSVDLM